ncbi:hypothetical protein ACFWUZ_15005 [Streptomyces sp. NPDC058646]|uniref:hypothetical protein n=1 Tax=Streptomyces sp. NPDC058646 TaxID=3346574 RepID=UPI0036506632
MNPHANALLDWLTVLLVAALLIGPALPGVLRERRTDRQLRAAGQGPQIVRHGHRRQQPRPGAAKHSVPAPEPGHPGRSPRGRGRSQALVGTGD